jgi:hypothetical protein
MAEKKKYPLHKSPEGELVWPALNVPDSYTNSDGQTKTNYKTAVRIAEELFISSGFKEFLDAEVEKALDEAVDMKTKQKLSPAARRKATDKGAVFPYKIPVDKEGNDIPGVIDVNFSISHGGIDKKTGREYSNKPVQFDSSVPKPKVIDVELRNGTVAKISFSIFYWATAALGYGVSLRPKAVQVVKLSERGAADADYFGFEGSDTGFSSTGGHSDNFGGTGSDPDGDETDEQIDF